MLSAAEHCSPSRGCSIARQLDARYGWTSGLIEWRLCCVHQMEKRTRAAAAGDHLARCRIVLQQGLSLNPDSAPLCQVPLHLLTSCSSTCKHRVLCIKGGGIPYVHDYISNLFLLSGELS